MWRSRLRDWMEKQGQRRILEVRWLLNPRGMPLRNVQIEDEGGIITAIRPIAAGRESESLPLMVIPPLVNAHTHLEFSALEEPLGPAASFPDWIRSVVTWRRAQPGSPSLAIEKGMTQCRELGVGLVGEIATQSFLHRPPGPACVVFREAIGLTRERIADQLQAVQEHIASRTSIEAAGSSIGLSPHAPYTVHPELMQKMTELAIRHRVPVAMHLAETREELRLLQHGDGAMADFLKSMGLFDSAVFSGHRQMLEFLEPLARVPQALAVHGNYFAEQELSFLVKHPSISVVYCPRTHAWFQHSEHPFRRMQAAGIRVVLGTDSRASNPDLCILSELQFLLRRHSELSVTDMLEMITTSAATALGRNEFSCPVQTGHAFAATLLLCDGEQTTVDATLRAVGTRPLLAISKSGYAEADLARIVRSFSKST